MNSLCRYFFGSVLVTCLLIALFESVNPRTWPKQAVGWELAACWLVIAAIGGHNMVKEEERQKQEAKRREEETAKTEMDKFHAELRSKEQVELEKHRLTLEAQRPKQEVAS
jgi:cell shape-determining protein MreC